MLISMRGDNMDLTEKTLEEKLIYKGNYLEIYSVKVQLPNGEITFKDIIKHPGATAIIPFIDDENVVLVKQFRKAINKVQLEIPAGKMEKGEKPIECASRELEEETGYKASKLTFLGSIATAPGFCDEVIHIFKAEGLIQGNKGGDDDEFIELKIVSLDKMKKMIKDGEIIDTKTISSLAYL